MKLTPAIKGQLTKAVKANPNTTPGLQMKARFNAVKAIFAKHLLPEQAKHATKQYLASLQ